jgi:hypothetical protein
MFQRPTFVCASLYLLSKLSADRSDFKAALLAKPKPSPANHVDSDDQSDKENAFASQEQANDEDEVDVEGEGNKGGKGGSKNGSAVQVYDGRTRDPKFAGANQTALWEMVREPFLIGYCHG